MEPEENVPLPTKEKPTCSVCHQISTIENTVEECFGKCGKIGHPSCSSEIDIDEDAEDCPGDIFDRFFGQIGCCES